MNYLVEFLKKRNKFTVPQFAIVVAFFSALFFHYPLWRFTILVINSTGEGGMVGLLLLFFIVFFIWLIFLLIVCILHHRLLLPLLTVIFLGNAVSLYFIDTYQVILDKSMMGNVFSTNYSEISELISFKLFLYVLVLGLLPSILIARFELKLVRRSALLFYLLGVISVFIMATYAMSSKWLWIDKNAKSIGGRILPWSYVANGIRYLDEENQKQKKISLLPSAETLSADKALVFLVIGESARSQNFSVYGYPKKTNERLHEPGFISIKDVKACATYTTAALNCILSHDGGGSSFLKNDETLPSYLQRHGVDVIWRTNNWGEPPMTVGSYLRSDSLRRDCRSDECDFDGVLLQGLEEQIRSSPSDKVFVVLHQGGSHGPIYSKKYPPRFERFQPVCRTTDLSSCVQSELFNAYDNSIFYTDYFIGRVRDIGNLFPKFRPIIIYVSDHGESLGEFGLFLHGTPSAIAPQVQTHIPFIVWMSGEFQKSKLISEDFLSSPSGVSQRNVFHTVMGAFNLRSPIYKEKWDLFSNSMNTRSTKQEAKIFNKGLHDEIDQ